MSSSSGGAATPSGHVRLCARGAVGPSPQIALALVARLDRDPRTLWAVHTGYGTGGRDLAADLRTALPEESEYIDHAFAQESTTGVGVS